MAIDLKQTAIHPDLAAVLPTCNTREAVRAALGDTQGNILKGHDRGSSRHLFVTFRTSSGGDRTKARQWPASMAQPEYVTSALTQWEEAATFVPSLSALRRFSTVEPAASRGAGA
ncbi:hypothetical protein [Streptacidiphilus pinicola]|uniref:hypothetical protein n=1 Tax=Streptacidiphilus pinicola TaxID=2219663 RepID=UPI001403C929|nr:hypothetical protein [Streptacidiphilus pinicola]